MGLRTVQSHAADPTLQVSNLSSLKTRTCKPLWCVCVTYFAGSGGVADVFQRFGRWNIPSVMFKTPLQPGLFCGHYFEYFVVFLHESTGIPSISYYYVVLRW